MKPLTLLILIAIAGNVNAQKLDTIKIVMLCSDTTHIKRVWFEDTGTSVATNKRLHHTYDAGYNQEVFTLIGYEVREKHNTIEGVIDPGYSQCVDKNGMLVSCYHDYFIHVGYLNKYYYPLDKNIIVWQTK